MIKWLALDALSFTKENPNRGNVEVIYQSIASHGYVNIVHVWSDGIIKVGEHRVRALRRHQKAGYIPSERDLCLRVQDGVWQVMCLDVSRMSEQQANQLMLMFNQSARLGGDDIDALVTILSNTSNEHADLYAVTGYTHRDFDAMLKEVSGVQPQGKSSEEAHHIFLQNDIRQITLMFTASEFDALIPRLDALMESLGIEDHTSLFLRMLDDYDKSQTT